MPLLLGFATGILSSWGVGGGTLLLLCMTLFLQVEQRTAQAINLLFFLPTAGVGLLFHKKNGYIHRETWRNAALPGVLGALAGAGVALWMEPGWLRPVFGVFLLYAGGSMLVNLWRSRGQGEKSNGSQGGPGTEKKNRN